MNHWLDLHPYTAVQPSDGYYVALANRLLERITMPELSTDASCRLALYLAAYLEDQVSGLCLWQTFLKEHNRLYDELLPFYRLSDSYYADEVNREDVAFLIWNTLQKEIQHDKGAAEAARKVSATSSVVDEDTHLVASVGPLIADRFVNPVHPSLMAQADVLYQLLADAYEEAPGNEALTDFFASVADEQEGKKKLDWLFGRTYLTEPAVLPYLANMAPGDCFIIPTGPLALFLYEWIDALGGDESWKQVKGLYVEEPAVPAEYAVKNKETYANFTAATQGNNIVFLDGYEALKRFLVDGLHWPDDENHTLPQLRESRDFILMVDPEKGMLLAKDICRFLDAPGNPVYDAKEAAVGDFRLLTEETLCPPDLLYRSIREGWIHEAQLPGQPDTRQLVVMNADFIARHALLYYYRGD